jgi:hypothetical protein
MCGFNVLSIPDNILTIQYAVDFLKHILINNADTIPQLNEVCRGFPATEFFKTSIQTLATLLVILDARSEESSKIYELLLSFCNIADLRHRVCSIILQAPPPPKRYTRPVQGVLRTAEMGIDEAPLPEVPIRALKMLDFLAKVCKDFIFGFQRSLGSNQ